VRLKPALPELSRKSSQPETIKDIESKYIAESYSNDILNTLQEAEKECRLTTILSEHQISK
jgi:hypothetical protein